VKSITYSHYYGDWKHATCITGMKDPTDSVIFSIRVTEPGDYRLILEYACPAVSSKQEGVLGFNGKDYLFQTLHTSEYDSHQPLLFIRRNIAITTVASPGIYTLSIHPVRQGNELFKLKTVILEPVE
jgi:alpha-L-fucosidase